MAELEMTPSVKQQAEAIRNQYNEYSSYNTFSALVMGIYGVGKTSLITTMPRPILIESFDPKGTVVVERLYPEEIKNGNILIRRYWDEDFRKPTEYLRWEDQWEADLESGFLDQLGTYAIDSLTTLLDALANYFSIKLQRDRTKQKLAMNDYLVIYDLMKNIIKRSSSRNCNFITTGHLVEEQDETTSKVEARLKTFKGLKTDIPLLFTEKYVLQKRMQSGIPKYELLATSAGRYEASTQLGAGGKINPIEEPNLKAIMKKVGMDNSDKPSLIGGA